MISIQKVMAFARAETRLNRRLIRYWFFVSVSYLIAVITFLLYSVLHGVYSSYSATEAMLSPRYLISTIGLYYLLIYIGGAVFLGFDIRARDQREQINEALDSRPFTNLELISGRFLGLLLSSWIPMVVMTLILEFLGLLLPLPFGDTMEIYSLFSFVFLMALPALAFILSLVFLVTLLIRNRLMSAVVLIILIVGDFWAIFNLPAVYSPLVDLTGSTIISAPSDIIPSLAGLEGWLQRIGVLLAAFSMVGFSAAVHPRLDGYSRKSLYASGIGIFILSLMMTGFGFYQNINDIKMADTWKEAHAVRANAPVPDIRRVSGSVRIEPGKSLNLDFDLTFSAPDRKTLTSAIFTLNPGQKVREATDTSGRSLNFTHKNGLLELNLPQPLEPDKETIVHLAIDGLPDRRFGYLYSAVRTENLKADQKDLSMLGIDRYIYDSRFVALMPGIRWLPASGTEKDRTDPRHRTIDYFKLDLTVDLPSGWLVAGPGWRQEVVKGGETDRVKFYFSPSAPLPEVAIIASKFESRSFEIEGVKMELLINPKHMKNVVLLADISEKIKTWIKDHLREAKEYGLGYPYDGLTLVEVPNSLRSYGGGWRMDTVMAPPGLLLMREISFPTARFDWPFRNPETFKDQEGGIAQAKLEALRTFFINDISGGNIFSGAARNLFLHQTSARGPEAIALNYVMEVLSTLLVTETGTYFSAHNFVGEDPMGAVFGALVLSQNNESSSKKSMADAAIEITTSRQEVWNQALKVSLRDINPWDDPALKINVLALKANAMARCFLDILGREKTAQLLSSLRDSYRGRTFSFDDVKDECKALGIDFEELFDDWINSTSLPGFICSKTEVYRLPDSRDGTPRYQLIISVRNDEPVSGVFHFRYSERTGNKQKWIETSPILLKGKSAVHYGLVMPQPPDAIWLEPYISLNQSSFMIPLGHIDHEKIRNVEAIEGLEKLAWAQPDSSSIVVDDLDKGFEVLEGEEKKDVQKGTRGAAISLNDKGLSTSTFYSVTPIWTRLTLPGSWGKYRHTATVIKAGEGKNKAIFTTTIQKAGSWDLDLYIPDKQRSFPGMKFGTWNLIIKDITGKQHNMEFNSGAALPGWNLVGQLDLSEGVASVTLSNKTDGDLVLADAIRWSPSVDE